MFEIEYKGGNAVTITTKKTKLYVDPALSVVGLKDLVVGRNDVQITTVDGLGVATESGLVFDGPGSYEVGDLAISGVAAMRHIDTEVDGMRATIYSIAASDIKTIIIGNIAAKLNDDQLETLGLADIVVIPVGGGGYTLDATAAAAMVRQIEPKVVIPVHYADDAIRYEVPQETLDVFIKELGAPVVEAGLKYKVKGAASLPDQLTLVTVSRS